MSDVYINFNNLTTFNAPLKSVSENTLRNANKYALNHSLNSFNALNPHLYNTVALIRTEFSNADNFINGYNVYGYYTSALGGANSTIGRFRSYPWSAQRYFKQEKYGDWCYYYQLKKINELVYDTGEYISSSFYYRPTTTVGPIGSQTTIYTPQSQMGKSQWCVIGSPMGDAPTATNNYNDWFYVSAWSFFNRNIGSTNPRNEYGSSSTSGVFPMVVWDIQNIIRYGRTTEAKPYNGVENGNYQGVTIFNPLYGNMFSRLGDWRFISTITQETTTTKTIIIRDEYKHASTLGDGVKLLLTNTPLTKWIQNENETIYEPTNTAYPILAFRDEESFLNLLADWGITRVTNDKDEARNKPSETFPNYAPTGGFNPDGGNNEGYETNQNIASIPSYPDNTSDRIIPVTPNISAINAASVYTLTLAGVKMLLNWLMTENFTKNISELFSDKLSAIDDLKIMPFDFVNHDNIHTQYSEKLTLANVVGDIPNYKILPNYNCIIDGGGYHYTAYWGDFNDYTAATYYLYIPYGGIVELSPSFVVNRDLRLIYALDIISGNSTAIIYSNDVFVKTVPCQMGQTIPITYTNTNQREIKNVLTALNAGTTLVNMAAGKTDIISGVLNIGNSVAKTALTNPLQIGSIGNFSANTALVMPQNPFLIISRIQQSIPQNMGEIIGKPSNTYNKIGSFSGSGFVQIIATHINTNATMDEQGQIIDILKSGIFL